MLSAAAYWNRFGKEDRYESSRVSYPLFCPEWARMDAEYDAADCGLVLRTTYQRIRPADAPRRFRGGGERDSARDSCRRVRAGIDRCWL